MSQYLLPLALLYSTMNVVSKTDETTMTHFVAHAGTAYALTAISYGTLHRGLGLSRTTSTVLSVVLTNLASLGREAIEAKKRNASIDGTDLRNAGIGSLFAAGTILVFKF